MKKIDYWDHNIPVPAPGGETILETFCRLAEVDPEFVRGKEHLLDSMVIVSYDVEHFLHIAEIAETIYDRKAILFALGIKRLCFLFLDALNNIGLANYYEDEKGNWGVGELNLFDTTIMEKDECVYLIPKL